MSVKLPCRARQQHVLCWLVAKRPPLHQFLREWCKSALARLALSEISIPERSERVFLRELMDGGRRRVRAHGALNGRVREIAVDEGRGQAAQFPGGIDAAHSKRRNARGPEERRVGKEWGSKGQYRGARKD